MEQLTIILPNVPTDDFEQLLANEGVDASQYSVEEDTNEFYIIGIHKSTIDNLSHYIGEVGVQTI